jgi:hypothetical protein
MEFTSIQLEKAQNDLIVYFIGASMILSSHLCFTNIQTSILKPHIYNHIQSFASTMQLGRVIWFIIQLSFPASALVADCFDISSWGTVCYYGCAFPATSVLIMKSTAILPPQTRNVMRSANFLALAIAAGFGISGTVFRNVFVNANGYCSIFYHRVYNMTSKAIFFAIYCTLLACFLIPSIRFFKINSECTNGTDVEGSYFANVHLNFAGHYGLFDCSNNRFC